MVDLLEKVLTKFRKELYKNTNNLILDTNNKYQAVHRIQKTLDRILLENRITSDIIEYSVSDPDDNSVWYDGKYYNDDENNIFIVIEFIDHLKLMKEYMLIRLEGVDYSNE